MPDPTPQELFALEPEQLFAYAMQNDVTNLQRSGYQFSASVMQFQILSKLREVAIAQERCGKRTEEGRLSGSGGCPSPHSHWRSLRSPP